MLKRSFCPHSFSGAEDFGSFKSSEFSAQFCIKPSNCLFKKNNYVGKERAWSPTKNGPGQEKNEIGICCSRDILQ